MPPSSPTRSTESLHTVADFLLELGRLLMECGASAREVENVILGTALAFGVKRIDLRLGYASLEITVRGTEQSVTCLRRIGPVGVDQRLRHALLDAVARIEQDHLTATEASALLRNTACASPHHPDLLVAAAVGIACAAFGRLLNVSWAAVAPIFVASASAQLLRKLLAKRKANVFLSTALVAFVASILAAFGSRWMGSETVARDMVVAVLLLVPGVPAFNAQFDILEGRPTLGSARAVWVMVTLTFMTAGVWLAQGLLKEGR